MKLKKIRRVISFKQANYLKEYIDLCTKLRINSDSEFGKRLWKLFAVRVFCFLQSCFLLSNLCLLQNACFGKTIEDVRRHLVAKLCRSSEICEKVVGNPRFSSMKIISENLVAVFMKPACVVLNKPYAVGFTILERSKDFMYQQFYNVIRPSLKNCDVQVIFSDTDSFCMAVKSREKGADHLDKLKQIFDFSNYHHSSPKFSKENANKLGFFKDELKGGRMTKFIGLRSKTYGYEYKEPNADDKLFKSRCKGVSKGYKSTIGFDKFENCIKTVAKAELQQYQIRSSNHVVRTLKIKKTAFTSFCDKRYLFPCGIHSTPYGSKLITSPTQVCPMCIFHVT